MERSGRNLLIRLTRPQVRLDPGEGQGRGAAKGGGEAGVSDLAGDARGAEEVAEADEACSPRRVLGGLHLCGSPPRGSAPLTSLFLAVSVYLSPTHPLSASLGLLRRESLAPKCRSETGRVPGASTGPFSLLSSLPLSGRIPRGNPPGGLDGASEDPGGQISLPFDRSFLIRSGFPPPRDGASAPARLPGLPQGVRVRPAPPRASAGDFCRVPGLEPPRLWAGRFGERSGRGSQAARGSPPLLPHPPTPGLASGPQRAEYLSP